MLKDILKDEAKGPGSQVPRATESRIPETPMWLASPCPAENMVPGWNPILLEEEIEGDHTPSANAADAADVANAADVLDALDALDAADAADVEIDASPTGYTPTLEAAECNEQHEEEVISDAGWTPVEADVSPDVGRANEAPAAEIDAEIDAMAPAAEIDAEIDAMVPQTPAVEDPECHQSEAIPADAEENDGAVCVALSSRSASEVPSDLTARSLAAQQMAWQAATEVHQRLYSLQQELDDVEDTPSSGSTIAACCAAELLLKVSEHLVGDMRDRTIRRGRRRRHDTGHTGHGRRHRGRRRAPSHGRRRGRRRRGGRHGRRRRRKASQERPASEKEESDAESAGSAEESEEAGSEEASKSEDEKDASDKENEEEALKTARTAVSDAEAEVQAAQSAVANAEMKLLTAELEADETVSKQVVAAGLQARIDLDEQLRVVKEDSETSREEAMQKALADLQAIRDEKIADAHREFEEDLEKAKGRIQQEVARAMAEEEARLKEESAASVAKAKDEIFKEAVPAAQREAKEAAQKSRRRLQAARPRCAVVEHRAMAAMLRAAWVATLCRVVLAHPSSMTCNYNCMAQYTPGSTFGLMYVPTIGATSGDTCKITTDIPQDGYAPDVSYTVTVTSLVPLAQKVTASSGLFSGSTSSNAGTKETSHSHTWTAPSSLSGSVSFRALCGDSQEMWYATEVSANIGSGPFTTATTSTTESTAAASSADVLPLGVEIGPSVHLFAEVQGNSVDVQALGSELASPWHNRGLRHIATGQIENTVRLVRALRNLSSSLLSAETSRAAEKGRSRPQAGREAPPPPPPPPVKEQERSSESESQDSEEDDRETGTTAPKSKPAKPRREDRDQEEDRRRKSPARAETPERRDEAERKEKKKKKKDKDRTRRGNRAGRNHQRLHRALENPDVPLHRKRPAQYWDSHHSQGIWPGARRDRR
eukprot:s250_g14.t3